ncbi:MAG: hypothetical protein DMG19_17640, partial [Acidobacteria bacterium]
HHRDRSRQYRHDVFGSGGIRLGRNWEIRMSQNPKPKQKIEAKPEHVIIVNQPMVRDFSTGGGHGPEDVLVEGDRRSGKATRRRI